MTNPPFGEIVWPVTNFDSSDEKIHDLQSDLGNLRIEKTESTKELDADEKRSAVSHNMEQISPFSTHDNITKVEKVVGTLETMHKTLCQNVKNPNLLQTSLENRRGKISLESNMSKLVAKIWVVKYVDYTSKYGLGFLLNTGCVGVYFNDSTKIVMSADGTEFSYIERRCKVIQGASEHIVENFSILKYPVELQKKVTLLSHFKNYLCDPKENEFERTAVTDMPKLANDRDESNTLPFLKKWVRTRHAILFRLSNRTVQVVFFDKR